MMKTFLLPGVMLLVGVVAGGAGGYMLRPVAPTPETASDATAGAEPEVHPSTPAPAAENTEIVKLNNQFVVPVVDKKRVVAMVVLSLSIETAQGQSSDIYAREPKLRDALLQVLFDHANIGGFDDAFTKARNMDMLRDALLTEARHILGDAVQNVLITDIARQDV